MGLLFYVGIAVYDLGSDYNALSPVIKGMGSKEVLSSVLLVRYKGLRRSGWIQQLIAQVVLAPQFRCLWPWDFLWRSTITWKRQDPPGKQGQKDLCQQACQPDKKRFKLGMMMLSRNFSNNKWRSCGWGEKDKGLGWLVQKDGSIQQTRSEMQSLHA